MKENKSLRWLIPLLTVLMIVITLAGLFRSGEGELYSFTSLHGDEAVIYGRGIYANDTQLIAAGFRGTDLVTLLLALPLIGYAYRKYRRGSLKGALALSGILSYLLYVTFSVTFAAAYNGLFLLYVAAFSASMFALIGVVLSVQSREFEVHVLEGMPNKRIAAFLYVAGGVVLLLWSSEIIPGLITGETPQLLDSYTTLVTHAVDMGLIAPAAFLAAVKIGQGNKQYFRLGLPLIILNLFIGICVISQTIFQIRAGVVFSSGQLIGMISSWVVLGGFAAWMIASLIKHIAD